MTMGAWTSLFEELLRGLVHAISNRITALSAFAELAAMDGEPIEAAMLQEEVMRLHQVSALVGVLATRGDEIEALEVRALLDLALTILSHHPRVRPVPCSVEQCGLVLPVRVPRWALLRLLLLMVDAAERASDAAQASGVAVQLSGDESTVRVHIVSCEPFGPDAERLAATCGGVLTRRAGTYVLALPSLPELRRRERSSSKSHEPGGYPVS